MSVYIRRRSPRIEFRQGSSSAATAAVYKYMLRELEQWLRLHGEQEMSARTVLAKLRELTEEQERRREWARQSACDFS